MRAVYSADEIKNGLPDEQTIRHLSIWVPKVLQYSEAVMGGILTGPVNSETPGKRSGGILYVVHDGSEDWDRLEARLINDIDATRVKLVLRAYSEAEVTSLQEARASLVAELRWAEKNGEPVIKRNPADFFPTFEVPLQEDIANYLLHKQEEYEDTLAVWREWEHEKQCDLLEDLFQSCLVTMPRRVLLAAHGEAAFDTRDLIQGFGKHLPDNPTIKPLVNAGLKLLGEIAESDYYYSYELTTFKSNGYEDRTRSYVAEVLPRAILLLKCCRQLVKAIVSGVLDKPAVSLLAEAATEQEIRDYLSLLSRRSLKDLEAEQRLKQYIDDPTQIPRSA